MRFPRNQGRALLERVASGEIKGAQCLTSQLIIIDDLSKSSRGQVRMQGAREKGYGRQGSVGALSVDSDSHSASTAEPASASRVNTQRVCGKGIMLLPTQGSEDSMG